MDLTQGEQPGHRPWVRQSVYGSNEPLIAKRVCRRLHRTSQERSTSSQLERGIARQINNQRHIDRGLSYALAQRRQGGDPGFIGEQPKAGTKRLEVRGEVVGTFDTHRGNGAVSQLILDGLACRSLRRLPQIGVNTRQCLRIGNIGGRRKLLIDMRELVLDTDPCVAGSLDSCDL